MTLLLLCICLGNVRDFRGFGCHGVPPPPPLPVDRRGKRKIYWAALAIQIAIHVHVSFNFAAWFVLNVARWSVGD